MKTTYHSVAEIFEAMDETRARLDATLDGLGAEQEALRDAPDRWSVAEVVEHVAIIEKQMTRLVGMLLAKAESDGATSAPAGGDSAAAGAAAGATEGPLVVLDKVAERAGREKYQSPEMALPRGGDSVSDSRARLRETRAALGALRPRVESANAAVAREATYPHPAFGPLNLYEWLVFVALHEDRHRRQIETLLGAA